MTTATPSAPATPDLVDRLIDAATAAGVPIYARVADLSIGRSGARTVALKDLSPEERDPSSILGIEVHVDTWKPR